ncbi:hypothetical protein F5B20DRAFT_317783 [Whalleya microplaca]|nr:hypothetical protein F5B20DRAFT_317783 [Whalleya microplaca]
MMLAHHGYPSRTPNPHQHYSSPNATNDQSNNYQSSTSLSTLDHIPAAAAAIAASQRYRTPATQQPQSQQGFDGGNHSSQHLSQVPDLMSSESWMLPNQQTPKATHRFNNHQRESSLSSLGSNGPASPYNASTSNPQIAVTDSNSDGYQDIGGGSGEGNYSYNLGKPLPVHDNFYANAPANFNDRRNRSTGGNNQHSNGDDLNGQHAQQHAQSGVTFCDGLANMSAQQQHKLRGDRGLAPAAEFSNIGSSTRSHPVSVASSITGGDSPATPSYNEAEDDNRRLKNVYNNQNMPKLDRTMTDIYSDELFNPNVTFTSASPPLPTRLAVSPSSDLFAQRLQAANSQHLSAVQSPVSNSSSDRSPFRQGSPYASVAHEFPQVGMDQVRLGSAQQIRQKHKAEQDAKELQQQMARNTVQQQGTPNTISPKDAVLDFNDSEDNSNFPLFPQETNNFSMGTAGSNSHATSVSTPFQTTPSAPSIQSSFGFTMPSNVQIPQQYPFIARRQQPSTPSADAFSRVSSAEASGSDVSDAPAQRPPRTNADGGTYTCTYHGCTLRFETPALLQKHKREGHRQANALQQVRGSPSAGAPGSMANSQAGPHRCDRINPSTGKPCNTVFSRPYDLTRHEDTIHNARKQKVRCDLCTEEKTFSRADALTRHYRVCHPDVEFPGKHRRRGGIGI